MPKPGELAEARREQALHLGVATPTSSELPEPSMRRVCACYSLCPARKVGGVAWLTLISTLSGGVLGVGSTLVVEALRAKRERGHHHAELERTACVRFLTALSETETALQTLALSRSTPVANVEVVEAFRSHHVLAAQYELFLVAPPRVYDAARETYNRLRAIRVAIATTPVVVGDDSADWQAIHDPYDDAFRQLRVVMRESLNHGLGL